MRLKDDVIDAFLRRSASDAFGRPYTVRNFKSKNGEVRLKVAFCLPRHVLWVVSAFSFYEYRRHDSVLTRVLVGDVR
jgi:hypothetical protein